MKQVRVAMLATLMVLLCGLFSQAQQSVATATDVMVPPLIPFSNVATDEGGNSLSGVVSLTFSLYVAQQGGEPLWTETQNNVPLDPTGHYSVQLGITQPNGVPTTLFTTGEARWLGVRIAEQPEQPRVLLLSVPYAMKAGDAATIGGLPPSAFVLAAPSNGTAPVYTTESATGQNVSPTTATDVTTSGGTVNYLPLWDTTSDIISSVLFQSGTGSTAKVGINTATPATTLDVKGTGTIRGTLSLPATGKATATKFYNSQPLNLAASAYNSSTPAAVNQTFQWQAEPVASSNDTSNPSGTLNLLFGSGTTKPSETGLDIASNGQITFATGQTFPGTGTGDGTVTSVATGLGLKGGLITTSGTLTIDPAVIPQLGAANTFTGNQTVNGTLNANASTISVQATATSVNGVGIIGLSSATTGTGLGVEGGTNSPSGSGVQGISYSSTGRGVGVFGVTYASAGWGTEGLNSAQTGPAVGVYGQSQSSAGYGVEGYSPNVGVYGTGLLGVQGSTLAAGGTGVNGAAVAATGNGVGVIGSSNSPTGYGVEGLDGASSGGTAGLFEVNTGSATILQGTNGGVTEFKVDSAGDVIAGGAVSGSVFQIAGQLFAFGSNFNTNAFLGFAGNTTMTGQGHNTAVGAGALLNDTTGAYNTASGTEALYFNSTGSSNTATGFFAGDVLDSSYQTGSFNTAMGDGSGFSTGTLNNATAVGANAVVSESNALVLGSGADVGIGTSAPTAALDVVGNSLQALVGDPGCGSGFAGVGFVNKGGFNSCSNYALLGDVPGNLYLNSSLSGTIYFRNNNGTLMTVNTAGVVSAKGGFSGQCLSSGAFDNNGGASCNMDLAEAYTSAQATEAGDLVALVPTSEATVRKSSKRYEPLLLGVVSTNPGLVFDNGKTHLAGDNSVAASKDKAVIALAGRVPVKVSIENGAVHVGDPLTSSSHPGVAMKATAAGKIIGYALAPTTKNGKVLMFVQPGYYAAPQLAQLHRENLQLQRENKGLRDQFADVLMQVKQQQSLLRAQSAAMRSLTAEVRETRENLQKVKAQVFAAQPALVAAK